jgi:hypothetical protein
MMVGVIGNGGARAEALARITGCTVIVMDTTEAIRQQDLYELRSLTVEIPFPEEDWIEKARKKEAANKRFWKSDRKKHKHHISKWGY